MLGLRYDDLRLNEGPFGMIRWRSELAKNRIEDVTAIDARTRALLDGILVERPGIGPAPLFPSPQDVSRPVSRDRADKWLRRAEKLAKLEHLDGTLWHAFRRKWGSELQYEAPTVVTRLGGWRDVRTMQRSYQHANADMMVDVLSRRREYREARR